MDTRQRLERLEGRFTPAPETVLFIDASEQEALYSAADDGAKSAVVAAILAARFTPEQLAQIDAQGIGFAFLPASIDDAAWQACYARGSTEH